MWLREGGGHWGVEGVGGAVVRLCIYNTWSPFHSISLLASQQWGGQGIYIVAIDRQIISSCLRQLNCLLYKCASAGSFCGCMRMQ